MRFSIEVTFDKPEKPLDMVLHCPACGVQHIDAPGADFDGHDHRWDNPPHRSHLCHSCGHVWRPADVATNGVAAVTTKGGDDSPPFAASPSDTSQGVSEADGLTCSYNGGTCFRRGCKARGQCDGKVMANDRAALRSEPAVDWRGFLELWVYDGRLQSFESREAFRKAARALLDGVPQ